MKIIGAILKLYGFAYSRGTEKELDKMSEWIWQGIGGATGVGIVFLVMKNWNDKMVKQIEGKASKESCHLQHLAISENLRKGDTRFERIEEKLDKLGDASSATHHKLDRLLDRAER